MLARFWLWVLSFLGLDPRGIFVFYDGRRWRRVDPFVIYRAIYEVDGFDPDTSLAKLNQGETRQKLKQIAIVADAVRRVFQVNTLNGGGLTDLECADLLSDFFEFADDLKKSTEQQPNWDPLTASLPMGISPMQAASVFGGTSTESADKPASPSGSES